MDPFPDDLSVCTVSNLRTYISRSADMATRARKARIRGDDGKELEATPLFFNGSGDFAPISMATLKADFSRFLQAVGDDEGMLFLRFAPHSKKIATMSYAFQAGFSTDKLLHHCNSKSTAVFQRHYNVPILSLAALPIPVADDEEKQSLSRCLRRGYRSWMGMVAAGTACPSLYVIQSFKSVVPVMRTEAAIRFDAQSKTRKDNNNVVVV